MPGKSGIPTAPGRRPTRPPPPPKPPPKPPVTTNPPEKPEPPPDSKPPPSATQAAPKRLGEVIVDFKKLSPREAMSLVWQHVAKMKNLAADRIIDKMTSRNGRMKKKNEAFAHLTDLQTKMGSATGATKVAGKLVDEAKFNMALSDAKVTHLFKNGKVDKDTSMEELSKAVRLLETDLSTEGTDNQLDTVDLQKCTSEINMCAEGQSNYARKEYDAMHSALKF